MPVRPFLNLPPPPAFGSLVDVQVYVRRQWDALLKLRRGKIECVTELTLSPGAAFTDLKDERLSMQSVVVLDPKSASAAAETIYCLEADRANGAWRFTHTNSAVADRKFQVAIIG